MQSHPIVPLLFDMPDLNLIAETQNLPHTDKTAFQESVDLYSRNRREQNALHWCFIVILWIIVIGFGIAILTKFLHMVLPEKYCWLDEDHIKKLNEFITTGGIGGIGTALFKNKIGSTNK